MDKSSGTIYRQCKLPKAADEDLKGLAARLDASMEDVLKLAIIAGLEQLWVLMNFKSSQSWTGIDFKEHMLNVYSLKPAEPADYVDR